MKKIVFATLVIALTVWACKKDEEPVDCNPPVLDTTPYTMEFAGLPAPQLSADNPVTEAKVLLGRMLFYEKKLSGNSTQACADCHAQADGFSDRNTFSEGAEGLFGKRQAMAIINMAWNHDGFFWDGRAPELRDQALLPIQDPLEMNETLPNVVAKLQAEKVYTDQFVRAFGTETVSSTRISHALEAFMFTIIANDSKYDQSLRGTTTLSASEERGRALFFAEYNPFFPNTSGADCAHCHTGVNFQNNDFMNNGLDTDAQFVDLGRYEVTENDADRAKFKVPTLRNIELTPPYMHDGRFATLEEVIDHYNEGIEESSTVDPTVQATKATGLMLTAQDKTDLVAFLKTLTDHTISTDERFTDPWN